MTEADALDMVQTAIWAVIIASSPAVVSAMIVGIVIAFFQALTQVQEVTLTFVPKIVTIFIVSVISAPFVGGAIGVFALAVFQRIETGF